MPVRSSSLALLLVRHGVQGLREEMAVTDRDVRDAVQTLRSLIDASEMIADVLHACDDSLDLLETRIADLETALRHVCGHVCAGHPDAWKRRRAKALAVLSGD